MKKVLSLILCLILIASAVSCTKEEEKNSFDSSEISFEINYQQSKKRLHPYVNSLQLMVAEDYQLSAEQEKVNGPWEIFHRDIIKNSTSACTAVLLRFETDGKYAYWYFEVKDLIYGELNDKYITVIQKLDKVYYTAYRFTVENEYLISFSDTVYNGELDKTCYRFSGGLLVDLTEMKNFEWHNGVIHIEDNMKKEDFIDYFKALATEYGYKTD